MEIPKTGTYGITTDGDVNGYISPRLAFGHDSSHGWLLWVFGGLFAMGLVELFAALLWAVKSGKKARPLAPHELLNVGDPTWNNVPPAPAASFTPTDQGIRIQQLQNLAALRDSGALTEEEFEAEKFPLRNRQIPRGTLRSRGPVNRHTMCHWARNVSEEHVNQRQVESCPTQGPPGTHYRKGSVPSEIW